MKPTNLLVLNTSVTYLRSLLAAVLILFSSRWVLSALGEQDYGLFALVGSVLVFVGYLNSVLASSSSRHFAFAIGQGGNEEVNRWFNAALSIHVCFAFLLTGIGWLYADTVIFQLLNIPMDRQESCLLVYKISLISLFWGMVSVPFVAMFRAKQHIAEIATWGILKVLLSFSLAWYLLKASGDRLLLYATGIAGIHVLFHLGLITRALIRFSECRIHLTLWFERTKVRELFSFASWNMIGMSALICKNEGAAVLLNLYFGPSANAAYGITRKVAMQVDQLAAAMLGAFSPEITSREGRGERESMIRLSMQASKFGTLLVLVFLVPLILEMDYVLKAWLVTPPEHTVTFCRLVLCSYLLDRLTTGYMIAINAHGRIAAYQATVGTTLLLSLPLAWLFLDAGFAPTSVGVAFVIIVAMVSTGRLVWAKRLLGISILHSFKVVALPCLLIAMASGGMALVPFLGLPPSFGRLLLVTGVSVSIFIVSVWGLALDKKERQFLLSNARTLTVKFRIAR